MEQDGKTKNTQNDLLAVRTSQILEPKIKETLPKLKITGRKLASKPPLVDQKKTVRVKKVD